MPILWSLDAKSILSGNEGFLYKSVGKESAHNAGDPGLILGLGRSSGWEDPIPVFLGFPGGSDGKESACNAGNLGLTPGLGRSLEEDLATTPVFLPGDLHGQRSLESYSP